MNFIGLFECRRFLASFSVLLCTSCAGAGPGVKAGGERELAAPSQVGELMAVTEDDCPIELRPGVRFGPAKAKDVFVVYTDTQCPYSTQFHSVLMELIEDHPNVAVVLKQFPLEFHTLAPDRAAAFLAAVDLNADRKWALYTLDEDRDATAEELDPKLAELAGVPVARFRKHRKSDAIRKQVACEQLEGKKYGFRGTPSFMFGDQKAQGLREEDYLEDMMASKRGQR